jgi:Rrf2 family protein
MNISAKTEYACLAVLELAAHYQDAEPVRVRAIAEAHGVPSRFLVQILLQLKGAGLVESTRGASGGYRLLRDPAEITLGEVMAIIEGPAADPRPNAGKETPMIRTLFRAWRDVAQAEKEMLAAVTFADLVEQVQGRAEDMFYI